MEIRIEKVKNRIWLRCEYRPDIPEKCKKINGASWLKEKKVWSYPLDYGTCLELREVFKHELVVGPALKSWASKEKARYENLVSISSEYQVDLNKVEKVSPALATAMRNRPYQQVGAAWMAAARSALLGDSPGLGKTLQTMGAVIEADITGPIMVLAPKTACDVTWRNELAKWLPNDIVFVPAGVTGKPRKDLLEAAAEYAKVSKDNDIRMWVLCNIEMARDPNSRIFEIDWEAHIVDESHRALVTNSPVLAKQTQQRRGIASLPLVGNGLRIALSGTPLRGKSHNLWGTLNWLRPDLYPAYWRWVNKYFTVYNDGWGNIIGDIRTEASEAFERDLKVTMLRRTKGEVLAELPDKQYSGFRLPGQEPAAPPGHWIEMSPSQAKNYEQMVSDGAADLEGGSLTANGALSERTRLKQFSSCSWKKVLGTEKEIYPCLPSNKFDWLINFLAERGIDGDSENLGEAKVIVASQYTKIINMFATELRDLGIECHVLTGETKSQKRKDIVDEFQSAGGPRVFLLNTTAGGVSLTLDAADDLVIIDETYNPDDQEQVEDRIHRASRMHQVTIHYVRSLGTVEEEIALDLGSKEQSQKHLLDGRRGVSFDKKGQND